MKPVGDCVRVGSECLYVWGREDQGWRDRSCRKRMKPAGAQIMKMNLQMQAVLLLEWLMSMRWRSGSTTRGQEDQACEEL